MSGLAGMEKFSHLEDKIYLTLEFFRKVKDDKESVEHEADLLRREVNALLEEKKRLEDKIERMISERDAMDIKVEAMLDAIAAQEPELANIMRG